MATELGPGPHRGSNRPPRTYRSDNVREIPRSMIEGAELMHEVRVAVDDFFSARATLNAVLADARVFKDSMPADGSETERKVREAVADAIEQGQRALSGEQPSDTNTEATS